MEHKPFRYRHDGWTPARQLAFLDALRETGCISEACRHVGLSRTSAARAYKRMPEFAEAWDLILRFAEPVLVKAAFERAVTGWDEPVFYKGEVVGHRRRWSDAMLRLLLQREQRPRLGREPVGAAIPAAAPPPAPQERSWSAPPVMPLDELESVLMRRLASVEKRLARKAAKKGE
jgi:hypothetical protein